jgi:hypothetical protein
MPPRQPGSHVLALAKHPALLASLEVVIGKLAGQPIVARHRVASISFESHADPVRFNVRRGHVRLASGALRSAARRAPIGAWLFACCPVDRGQRFDARAMNAQRSASRVECFVSIAI